MSLFDRAALIDALHTLATFLEGAKPSQRIVGRVGAVPMLDTAWTNGLNALAVVFSLREHLADHAAQGLVALLGTTGIERLQERDMIGVSKTISQRWNQDPESVRKVALLLRDVVCEMKNASSPTTKKRTRRTKKQLAVIEAAAAVEVKNSEGKLSDSAIAGSLGVHRSVLNRSKLVQAARKMFGGEPRVGFRKARDGQDSSGDVEAVDD